MGLSRGFSSVQLSRSVVSDSLRPHGLQNARPPCPSPTPGVYSNSCPLSWWCHPTISSSVVPFSSCLQSFPVSGSFPVSQFFASGGQSVGVSASASVLPMYIQGWFPLGLTGVISLLSKGPSRIFSNTAVQKHQFFGAQPSLWSNPHIHTWLPEKPALTIWTFVGKVMSLLFNTLSRFVTAFLPRLPFPPVRGWIPVFLQDTQCCDQHLCAFFCLFFNFFFLLWLSGLCLPDFLKMQTPSTWIFSQGQCRAGAPRIGKGRSFKTKPHLRKLLKGLPVDRVRVGAGDWQCTQRRHGGMDPRATAFMSIFVKTVRMRPRGS